MYSIYEDWSLEFTINTIYNSVTIMNIKSIEQPKKKSANVNVGAKTRRPRNFDGFLSLIDEDNYSLKYLSARDVWLKENRAKHILDKIPSSELPECEDFNESKVGDFISRGNFEDTYDETGEVYDALGENGILCYIFNDEQSWWKIKKDKEGTDGLVRFK